jgi:glutathione S-transferase
MSYILHIGDKAYSSWSLRGWLLLRAFGLPVAERLHHMDDPAFDAFKAAVAPSRTVPTLEWQQDGRTLRVWDSLAIAETLAERHPGSGHWPADPAARAVARSITAEMHSGFMALRREAPMNTRRAPRAKLLSADAAADLARIEALWAHARSLDAGGPFLFGSFSAADAFYAPIAWRITGYALPVGPDSAAYVAALLGHPAMQEWTAAAASDPRLIAKYEAM